MCTITVIHGQQYLAHRKTAATGVPHWHDAPPRISDGLRVLHRSHNVAAAALTAGGGGARLGRTRRNVVSCAVENPDYATIWYDDAVSSFKRYAYFAGDGDASAPRLPSSGPWALAAVERWGGRA